MCEFGHNVYNLIVKMVPKLSSHPICFMNHCFKLYFQKKNNFFSTNKNKKTNTI